MTLFRFPSHTLLADIRMLLLLLLLRLSDAYPEISRARRVIGGAFNVDQRHMQEHRNRLSVSIGIV